ncbi:MAG: GxxExxY protein [bacterium]|nr:MAG: GxxExxY protein [bacterium]
MTRIHTEKNGSNNLVHKNITDKILKIFYTVYNELGFGFLEKVYENALIVELRRAGLKYEQQKRIQVYYKENLVGEYFADLVIEDKIIVELKSAEKISKEHEFQLINYLKSTEFQIGLLLNFGKKPEFKRKIYTI